MLVAGLVAPTTGVVRLAPGVRSIVFQEAFLLGGTVADNVAFGADYTDEQLWEALDMAAADDFVSDLPARPRHRGRRAWGQPERRAASAGRAGRALVRRPSLLVLDDTTSALDPTTESIVLSNLRARLQTTSVLIVASRPSTIALADDVVYVASGRVGAHGTHEELMRREPAYRELVEAFESDRSDPDRTDAIVAPI